MSSEQPEQPAPPPLPPEAKRSSRKWLWLFLLGGIVATVGGVGYGYFFRRPLSPNDSPEKTYQKIFAAYGGQEALDKWKRGVVKYEHSIDLEVATGQRGLPPFEVSYTETFSLPGRLRQDMQGILEPEKRETAGYNGRVEWSKNTQGEIEVRPSRGFEDAEYLPFLRFYHPHAILQAGENLSVVGVETRPDGGRDLVIERLGTGPPTTKCFVDMKTKLLREMRGAIPPPFKGEGEARFEYGEYRMTDGGGMVPARITAYIGQRRLLEYRFISVEFRDHIDPTLFEPPTK